MTSAEEYETKINRLTMELGFKTQEIYELKMRCQKMKAAYNYATSIAKLKMKSSLIWSLK